MCSSAIRETEDWLKQTGLRWADLALLVKSTRPRMSKIRHGHALPTAEQRRRWSQVTKGRVHVRLWLEEGNGAGTEQAPSALVGDSAEA